MKALNVWLCAVLPVFMLAKLAHASDSAVELRFLFKSWWFQLRRTHILIQLYATAQIHGFFFQQHARTSFAEHFPCAIVDTLRHQYLAIGAGSDVTFFQHSSQAHIGNGTLRRIDITDGVRLLSSCCVDIGRALLLNRSCYNNIINRRFIYLYYHNWFLSCFFRDNLLLRTMFFSFVIFSVCAHAA